MAPFQSALIEVGCSGFAGRGSPGRPNHADATREFEEDKAHAREVTYADWLGRPAWQRATDAGAALLRSQL